MTMPSGMNIETTGGCQVFCKLTVALLPSLVTAETTETPLLSVAGMSCK